MTIWKRVLDALPSWPWSKEKSQTSPNEAIDPGPASPADRAKESLRALLDDAEVPAPVRKALAHDFAEVQAMLDKLEHGHIHIAVFGRVSVGKSALLNALLGEQRFSTSPLHGETREPGSARWKEWDAGGVFLIDTPGIDDVAGEAREQLAHAVAHRADLILFVVDGDITHTELSALRRLALENRPVVLVLNKIDRYTQAECALLLQSLTARTAGLIPKERIITVAANPAERVYIQADETGQEVEFARRPPPDVLDLRNTLWTILEAEGKTLVALNATLFAGKLSDNVTQRIMAIKKDLADKLIMNYCLVKGMLVGLNPVPLSDLIAAGAVDVSLILHLSRIYGLPMTRAEAGQLILTIGAQMALVMGTVWAVHFVSSALKGGSAGLSTILTGATQGAVAYYSAYVVGQAAQNYLAHGRSWGPQGPKRVVQHILDDLDRDSLLAQAREQIMARLRTG